MNDALKPILAVTMGDAAGTGPELLTKALVLPEVRDVCRPVVIGDERTLRSAARSTGSKADIRGIASPAAACDDSSIIVIADLANIDSTALVHGKVDPVAGHAAYEYIKRAVEFTLDGESHAIVTSAINKAALHAVGHRFDGHTELLSELCGRPKARVRRVGRSIARPRPSRGPVRPVRASHRRSHKSQLCATV